MDAARLYESPFTDLTPRGADGIFVAAQVEDLLEISTRFGRGRPQREP